jgi:hypothetical protein
MVRKCSSRRFAPTDDRHVYLRHDVRDGLGCGLVVHRDAHQLAAGGMQGPHLCRRAFDIGGIGVRHRLDDDRVDGAHLDAADRDDAGPATLDHA